MGGRGTYSYSGSSNNSASSKPLSAYAVASLNKGVAKGTTYEQAIERFREQLMTKKVEYSAYIDDNGYAHALGSIGEEGATKIASPSVIAKEKGVSTVIHNHPYGGSDGRFWGGTFSEADLSYISATYNKSNGGINKIIATSKEGTYTATVKKRISGKQIQATHRKAEQAIKGKKFQSEKAMWKALNTSLTKEFGKIGINIKFNEQTSKKKKLVTQKIGTYPA